MSITHEIKPESITVSESYNKPKRITVRYKLSTELTDVDKAPFVGTLTDINGDTLPPMGSRYAFAVDRENIILQAREVSQDAQSSEIIFTVSDTYESPQNADESQTQQNSLPWDFKPTLSMDSRAVTKLAVTHDALDHLYVKSNGEPVESNIQRSVAVFTITRARRPEQVNDSIALSSTVSLKVNSSDFSLAGTNYPAYTLLCEACSVTFERIIDADGSRVRTYPVESISIAYDPLGWWTRVPDVGSYVIRDGVRVYPVSTNAKTLITHSNNLNGAGELLNSNAQSGTTPQGVPIDAALSSDDMVFLKFMDYETTSFSVFNFGRFW